VHVCIIYSKCNPEMVELLPLNEKKDVSYVRQLLEEFEEKTGSLIAKELLDIWPEPTNRIFKVFPYEYQRALKQLEEDKKLEETRAIEAVATMNGNVHKEAVIDIEDVIADADVALKKLDKIK
jgi:glutamate synthase (NADPH/NADH)